MLIMPVGVAAESVTEKVNSAGKLSGDEPMFASILSLMFEGEKMPKPASPESSEKDTFAAFPYAMWLPIGKACSDELAINTQKQETVKVKPVQADAEAEIQAEVKAEVKAEEGAEVLTANMQNTVYAAVMPNLAEDAKVIREQKSDRVQAFKVNSTAKAGETDVKTAGDMQAATVREKPVDHKFAVLDKPDAEAEQPLAKANAMLSQAEKITADEPAGRQVEAVSEHHMDQTEKPQIQMREGNTQKRHLFFESDSTLKAEPANKESVIEMTAGQSTAKKWWPAKTPGN